MNTNKSKNICYVLYREYPEPNIEYLSKIVLKHGYEVSIVILQSKESKPFEVIDGRKTYRISLPGPSNSRKSIFAFNSKVAALIDEKKFDIVHLNSSCLYFGHLKLRTKYPAQFIYHSMSYPLADSVFQRVKQMLITALQCRLMNRTIFQTQEAKDHWVGAWLCKNIAIVPVGFDKHSLYPLSDKKRIHMRECLGIAPAHCVIAFCGAISKFRKLDNLIRAFNNVTKNIKNTKLIMIGDGDALQDCKTLVNNLKMDIDVIFTGRLAHSQLVDYLGAADIGISYVPIIESYTYNAPLKTFEYLACELPTIATKTVSNSKIIKDGYNGVLCGDSVEDTAQALLQLIQIKDLRVQLSKNARKSIMEFDFENIAQDKLLPIYQYLRQN